jgi:hypothetical protein
MDATRFVSCAFLVSEEQLVNQPENESPITVIMLNISFLNLFLYGRIVTVIVNNIGFNYIRIHKFSEIKVTAAKRFIKFVPGSSGAVFILLPVFAEVVKLGFCICRNAELLPDRNFVQSSKSE